MITLAAGGLKDDVEKLRQSLVSLPSPCVDTPFVVVCGLPGMGKSLFCRKLAERLPFVNLSSDALRRQLFLRPSYSDEENKRLFPVCHILMRDLLKQGIPVIFDATNLLERHREYLYRIADETRARLFLVRVEAPPAIARWRLENRKRKMQDDGESVADWEIYRRMKLRTEAISRNHFVVDTSGDISPAIEKIVRLIKK
jgi:hypothetical protein